VSWKSEALALKIALDIGEWPRIGEIASWGRVFLGSDGLIIGL
jgi:hypothetical protein